ncbi:pyridoxamine 5'-phosphate oxidase-like protein [Mumia flava]|uniref:Pyridoxamine 5'-phosphate oxidase-like protein n=1 Tax=Mumia flava TaxID=1348852 RepID=A0A2M9BFV8_9ACTN|nr:pyridoxamine 5'-phosphate oxidase family protein [Mumia flava]PJJ56784.1 pyridoxamine 5'-phosphate oxidase-like protein [Mumia flava]
MFSTSPGSDRPAPGNAAHVLGAEECRELLTTTTVGRVAFCRDGTPVLLPVNFRVVDDVIAFRTSPTSPLAVLAEHDGEVVFEVDHHDDVFRHGWSVIVSGRSAAASPAALATADLRSWQHGTDLAIAIVPERITGRRVAAR